MERNKKVAIFGGTFNPPHIGHIIMASEIATNGGFDEVLVIPSKIPPHKTGYFAPEDDRLLMCREAFSNIPNVKVLDIELKMSGKSYTLLTLQKLLEMGIKNPTLVIGADSLVDFHKWYKFEEILKLSKLLVYKRVGISDSEIFAAKERLENFGGEISVLELTPPDISSTAVRNIILNGGSLKDILAPATEKYIREKGLYSGGGFLEPQFSDKCIVYREEYKNYVELLMQRLTEKRFYHTLCVAKEAVRLAEKYGADTKKAFLSGILHDICKDMSESEQLQLFKEFGIILDSLVLNAPKLWHSALGAEYLEKKLGITDSDILNAVRYHTTARANMSLLEKIIYLADFTSEERDYSGVEDMRRAVNISLEKAMFDALEFSVNDLKEKNKPVHPDTLSAFEEAKSNFLK